MSRRSFLLAVGIALVLVLGTSAGVFMLVRYEPAAYRLAAVPPGPERRQQSEDCKSEISLLWNSLHSEQEWDIRLSDKQVNSYFAEAFKVEKLDERLLPEGVNEPRVIFEKGKVRLAFRYGKGLWSTIISIDFNVWLTEEPNVVALKLFGVQAGSLPIGAQALLDELTEMLENNGIQVHWYREEGCPVAVLRFQTDQRESTVQLQHIEVEQHRITIRGKPSDGGSTHAAALAAPRHEGTAGN
jgi:hypothetical protein